MRAHVDLHQLFVRVDARELRPDRGVFLVHLAEPERRGRRRLQDVVQPRRLGQPLAVQVDGAGMVRPAFGIEPVAVNEIAVGIEAAEERIGQDHFPDIILDLHPVLDDLRSPDLNLLARRGLIDDALRVGLAAARRADAFAVNALMHGDHVARLREIGGAAGSCGTGPPGVPGLTSLPLVATWNSAAPAAVLERKNARNVNGGGFHDVS